MVWLRNDDRVTLPSIAYARYINIVVYLFKSALIKSLSSSISNFYPSLLEKVLLIHLIALLFVKEAKSFYYEAG